MLTLYGFQFSNYVAMVQLALLEKNVPFKLVEQFPDRSAELMDKSPLGKVPFIETVDGFLSEASVILEYLEEHIRRFGCCPGCLLNARRRGA